jgi:hypothetical protein
MYYSSEANVIEGLIALEELVLMTSITGNKTVQMISSVHSSAVQC